MAEIVTGPLTEDEEEDSNIVSGRESEQQEQEEVEEEEQEQGEQFKEFRGVDSSMVAEVAFDSEAQTLEVIFVNGHQENYSCDQQTFEALLEAASIGQFMHQNFL
jgi:hypothetical protein